MPAKPLRQFFVASLSLCDACDDIRDHIVFFNEFVTASLHQQFDEVQGCSLVTVLKPMIADDSMNERRRLLVDESVVAVVGTRYRRPNAVLVQNPWGFAVSQCLLVAEEGIGLGDVVVRPTDSPAPSWPSDA